MVCGGGESLAPYYLLAGAQAFTSGIANLLPGLALDLYEAAAAGRWGDALVVQQRLLPLIEMRGRPGRMIPVIKEGLKMMGLAASASCRPPLMPLDPQEMEELRRVLESLGAVGEGVNWPEPILDRTTL